VGTNIKWSPETVRGPQDVLWSVERESWSSIWWYVLWNYY